MVAPYLVSLTGPYPSQFIMAAKETARARGIALLSTVVDFERNEVTLTFADELSQEEIVQTLLSGMGGEANGTVPG